MKYDFDMVPVVPRHMRAKLAASGRSVGQLDQEIALFRDPKVVLALQSADAAVKTMLISAGFGLSLSEARFQENRYAPADIGGRTQVMQRLHNALDTQRDVLRDHDWGGFSIADFIDHVAAAQPLDRITGRKVKTEEVLDCRELRGAFQGTKVAFWSLFGLVTGLNSGVFN
ncbi:MAG: hypothetical protein ACRBBU_03835 [Pseudooceanicola sp.]